MTNVFHLLKRENPPPLKYSLARLQTLQLISSYDRTSARLNSGRAVTAARSILFKSGGDICEGHYVQPTSANCHPFNMSVMFLCQVQPSGALPSPSGCRDQCSGLGFGGRGGRRISVVAVVLRRLSSSSDVSKSFCSVETCQTPSVISYVLHVKVHVFGRFGPGR